MRYILLFLFVLVCYTASAQLKGKTTFIPEKYALNKEKALEFQKGDTLIIQCDRVFLINKKRFELYRDLHANILKPRIACQALVERLQQDLEESKKAYDALLINCEKRSKLSDELIQNTISDLSSTHKGLEESQESLKKSIDKLADTEERLSKIKKENFNQKLLTGAAGVGLGILLGVLVSH